MPRRHWHTSHDDMKPRRNKWTFPRTRVRLGRMTILHNVCKNTQQYLSTGNNQDTNSQLDVSVPRNVCDSNISRGHRQRPCQCCRHVDYQWRPCQIQSWPRWIQTFANFDAKDKTTVPFWESCHSFRRDDGRRQATFQAEWRIPKKESWECHCMLSVESAVEVGGWKYERS